MNKYWVILIIVIILTACFVVYEESIPDEGLQILNFNQNIQSDTTINSPEPSTNNNSNEIEKLYIYEPIDEFQTRITKKPFGIYITPKNSPVQPEKFTGYHTGVDVEYEDVPGDVEVRAVADGQVVFSGTVNGYGRVVVIQHKLRDEDSLALYGHLAPDSLVAKGQIVTGNEKIGILGNGYTAETSGERKHLHFGIVRGTTINFAGYVNTESQLKEWYNPMVFYN